jgi:hypothetical protein
MKDKISEFINERKSNHEGIVSYNEAETKQAIILPIIRLLGWNDSKVDEVTPEYSVEKTRVDYSLRLNNRNKYFIEVKKPSEDLENHQLQLLDYSFKSGVGLATLTNGIKWWFYLPMQEDVDWRDRKFYTIDISQQDSDDIASRFIELLSKDNVENDSALNNARLIYKGRQKKREIDQALPEVWKNMMGGSDDSFIEFIVNKVESKCGREPDREYVRKFIIKQSEQRNPEHESRTQRSGSENKQFELTVPTAFLTWGGFSVRKIYQEYFPDKEKKEHSFKIHILRYGEIDAWKNQKHRIKINGKEWRQIVKKLNIKAGDKFTGKVIVPHKYYKVSKVN